MTVTLIEPFHSATTKAFFDSVQSYALATIEPQAEAWDAERKFPRALFRDAAKLGLFGIREQPSAGGLDKDWQWTAAAIEALTYGASGGVIMGLLAQSDLTIPLISRLAPDDVKAEVLPAAIAGETILALAISEPDFGSDVANLQCSARRDGDDYVLHGKKYWITNGSIADYIVVAVRTAEGGHKGISLLLVPAASKGFKANRGIRKVGNLASDTAALEFTACRVPSRYLLGQENKGFYAIMENFLTERLVMAIYITAAMTRAVEQAVAYGKSRMAFGKAVGSYQVWQHRFAEHIASITALRALVGRTMDGMTQGLPVANEVTMAKYLATSLSQKVIHDCMQIHGGNGYTEDFAISRMWRDLRLYSIGGGSEEIMKEILVKNLQL